MLVQVSTVVNLAIVCDTLSNDSPLGYNTPSSTVLSKNGAALAAGGGINSSAQPGSQGPYIAYITLATNDTDTVGTLEVVVEDVASNIIGYKMLEVVSWDPLAGNMASVVGAVGSVTGSVGSVVGNVSGSVGSVVGAVGSVTGSVGSVTGAVGSVTGNVGGTVASVVGNVGGNVSGNVTGTVGGLVNNAITTASIADGAITDAKFTVPTVSGVSTGVLSMLVQVWRRLFKRVHKDSTTIKTYADDGTTVITTQTYSADPDDIGAAT